LKSYNQSCALAKCLDLVGDRWTLLIIRELLIRESCRYTDIRTALPGIASNLLADRLNQLESHGLIFREDAPPPVATTLFHLTERGQSLEPAILELGRWGSPLLMSPSKKDMLQAHWLVLPLRLYLRDQKPSEAKIIINVLVGAEAIAVEASQGRITVRLGALKFPDAVVKGKPESVLRLFTGRTTLAAALAEGVQWEGSPSALGRVVGVRAQNRHGPSLRQIPA